MLIAQELEDYQSATYSHAQVCNKELIIIKLEDIRWAIEDQIKHKEDEVDNEKSELLHKVSLRERCPFILDDNLDTRNVQIGQILDGDIRNHNHEIRPSH